MRGKGFPTRHLRLAIFDDSPYVLKLVCDWFRQHHCAAAIVAKKLQACLDVERFVSEHKPAVVVYDVPMRYASRWDLLEIIRAMPSLRSQPFVVTTRNKRQLDQVVGRISAIEIAGEPEDLRRLLGAVEIAGTSVSER